MGSDQGFGDHRSRAHRTFATNITGDPVWPRPTGADSIVRLSLMFTTQAIMSISAYGDTGIYNYIDQQGTSMACPHVSGIIALMLQKYKDTYHIDIHNRPFWNSTARAILCHTATDLVDTIGVQSWECNPDFAAAYVHYHPGQGAPCQPTIYGVGPDWATGYGLANAQKAVQYVDRTKFREDTIANRQSLCYNIIVPSGTTSMRATLSWDDPAPVGNQDNTNCYGVKLVNDLDLYIVPPGGGKSMPWVIDHRYLNNGTLPNNGLDSLISRDTILAHPAYKGRDSLNNIEVVDVVNPVSGTWRIVVEGRSVPVNQSIAGSGVHPKQDFSLVTDFQAAIDTSTGLYYKRNGPSLPLSFLSIGLSSWLVGAGMQ